MSVAPSMLTMGIARNMIIDLQRKLRDSQDKKSV